jgi:hypothetical protein
MMWDWWWWDDNRDDGTYYAIQAAVDTTTAMPITAVLASAAEPAGTVDPALDAPGRRTVLEDGVVRVVTFHARGEYGYQLIDTRDESDTIVGVEVRPPLRPWI